MPAPVYLGDETSGAGFALAGVRVRVPEEGTESAALALARAEAPLVLVSAAVAARVPEPELRRACLALGPLTVVVPDLARHHADARPRGAARPRARPRDAAMTTGNKTAALLALVETDRAAKCGAILDAARAEADAIAAEAHAAARTRMRTAFAEERECVAARIAAADANLETRRRIARQQRAAALLASAWERLPAALLARWHDAQGRRAWAESVAADAGRALPHAAWQIVHAPGWPAAERDALAGALRTAHEITVSFVEDPRVRCGLKIAADHNVVDGTQEGLLADRAEIGAGLLDLLSDAE